MQRYNYQKVDEINAQEQINLQKKLFFLQVQEENDKVLFEKVIIERSVLLLKKYHIVTFEQYYLFNI